MTHFARGALLFSVLLATTASSVGCELFQGDAPNPQGTHDASTGDNGGDDGSIGPGDDGSVGPGDDGGADASTKARIRLANFATGSSAGGVDVCVAPHSGGPYQGPLLAGLAADALVGAGQVSAYVAVDPGAYDLKIVPVSAAGKGSCAAPGGVELLHVPELAAGTSFTIVATSLGADAASPPLVLPDEGADATKALVRFVNATASTADYGLGGGVAYAPLAQGVPPDGVDTCDTNGYCGVPLSATAHVDSSLRIGGVERASTPDLALAPGSRVTAFAFDATTSATSDAGDDAGAAGPMLLACDDDRTSSASPWLGACTLGGPLAPSQVRLANFIATPLPGGADLCVRYSGLAAYVGPVLGAFVATGGVSPYATLHAGFDYDLAIATAGGGCASPVAGTDQTIHLAPPNDTGTTIVAMGYIPPAAPDAGAPDASTDAAIADASDDASDAGDTTDASDAADAAPTSIGPTLNYVPFADYDGTALPVVRVINAAADAPQPLTLIASSTASSGWSFSGVSYGDFGRSGTSLQGTVDSRGFLPIAAGQGTLAVPGATYDWSAGASDHDTYFLFGGGDAGVHVTACTESTTSTCALLTPH